VENITSSERQKFWQECVNKARKSDLSHSYFAKKADNSVGYDIRFDSAKKIIQAAKEKTIVNPFARSNPIIFNELRAFEVPLGIDHLAIAHPNDLERWVENQLVLIIAQVFFKANNYD
jgi:hypothetical protein